MPTYVYETTSTDKPVRRFEVMQSMKDEPLRTDPETGEPVRRVISGGLGVLVPGSSTGPSVGSCGSHCGCHSGLRLALVKIVRLAAHELCVRERRDALALSPARHYPSFAPGPSIIRNGSSVITNRTPRINPA